MHPLATAALAQFDEIHDDLRRVVGDLQAEALNWRPGEQTNSIYVLVTHLLGAEHFWLAAAAGRPVARDREAEFRAQGRDPTGLLRLLEEADARNRDLLSHLTPETLAAIARWSGRTGRTVARWLRRFAQGGPAAVADAPRTGRPPRADAAYRQALETAVETPPRDLGLPFDVWTSARLSAYLAQTRGVRIAPGWLRVLLAQQDFACGRPKHTLGHLQDPAEVAACQAALAVAKKKGGGRAHALRDALPG